jgi:DNA-binding transcriptional MerR regulator
MAIEYTVKKMANAAGVSVRTLHIYDRNGLLKPNSRNDKGYRVYCEAELLRLQQILFYLELDVPLKNIGQILDSLGFDGLTALHQHREQLITRQTRLEAVIQTIDKTIISLNNNAMLNTDELYKGLPKETVENYRSEATAKYSAKKVTKAENYLNKLSKEELKQLASRQKWVTERLEEMKQKDPQDSAVQLLIADHYEVIRQFWGTAGSADRQAEAYKGLGKLYTENERFLAKDGKPQPKFASFLCKAMEYFAYEHLQ